MSQSSAENLIRLLLICIALVIQACPVLTCAVPMFQTSYGIRLLPTYSFSLRGLLL
jgi:hypothetical protein